MWEQGGDAGGRGDMRFLGGVESLNTEAKAPDLSTELVHVGRSLERFQTSSSFSFVRSWLLLLHQKLLFKRYQERNLIVLAVIWRVS